MAVVGVRAEADVGHHDQRIAELALEILARALHGAVCGGRRTAVGRLAAVLGMAEEQHGLEPKLEILADRLHDRLDPLLRDPGHRGDRLVRARGWHDEVRHDQLVGAHARLGDEVAERGRPPQAAQARPARRGDPRLRHCIASQMLSKLGSRASAVTSRPSARAAAVVDGPIV